MSNLTDSMMRTMMMPIQGMQEMGKTMMGGACPGDAINKMAQGFTSGGAPVDLTSWMKSGQEMIARFGKGQAVGLDPRSWVNSGQAMMARMTGAANENFAKLASGNPDPATWVELMQKMMAEMSAMAAGGCCASAEKEHQPGD